MRLVQPIVLSALIACVGGAARAQTLAGNPPPPKRLEIKAGYEVHRDHLRYTFENPSNIDTDFPVPHSFTQAYVANNHWLVLAARYLVGGDAMESEFAITPERQTPGSDLDTFYDPNNDVVVSGNRLHGHTLSIDSVAPERSPRRSNWVVVDNVSDTPAQRHPMRFRRIDGLVVRGNRQEVEGDEPGIVLNAVCGAQVSRNQLGLDRVRQVTPVCDAPLTYPTPGAIPGRDQT